MTKIKINALFTIALNKAVGGGMTANICKSGMRNGTPKVSLFTGEGRNMVKHGFVNNLGLFTSPKLGFTGEVEPNGTFIGPFEPSEANAQLMGKVICDIYGYKG